MPVAEAHFAQTKFGYFLHETLKQRRPLRVSTDAGAHGKLEIDLEEAGIVCRISTGTWQVRPRALISFLTAANCAKADAATPHDFHAVADNALRLK